MYHQTITTRRELAENVAQDLDGLFDEASVFVDLTDQMVSIYIPEDISGESDEELDGHEVVWLERVSSHEAFEVMEDFACAQSEQQAGRLLRALRQRHPFRVFRRALEEVGLLDAWYKFKNDAYTDLAAAQLEDAGVDVVDGKIVCTDKSSISVYESHSCDGADDFGE